jgi:hypothetical protein
MSELVKIDNHAEQARELFTAQFREQINIERIANALAKQIQDLEDANWQLHTERKLSTAVGAQLDILGDLVGQARDGATDAAFRVAIAARLKLNLCSGTVDELNTILSLILSPDVVWSLTELPKAALRFEFFNIATEAEIAQITRIIRSARAAGVRTVVTHSFDSKAETFSFSGGLDSPQGFGVGVFAGGREA